MKKIENKIKILTEKIKDQNDTKNEILFLNEMKKVKNGKQTMLRLNSKQKKASFLFQIISFKIIIFQFIKIIVNHSRLDIIIEFA